MDGCVEIDCGCTDQSTTCVSVSAQYADVSLPVKIKPYATLGDVQTDCCGEPFVTVRQIAGYGCGGCEIIIMQPICIRIPVEYGTTAEAGEPAVNCKRAPGGGCAPCR